MERRQARRADCSDSSPHQPFPSLAGAAALPSSVREKPLPTLSNLVPAGFFVFCFVCCSDRRRSCAARPSTRAEHAMFFLVERTESVALSPAAFGRSLKREVEDALRAKVEGKCTGKYGFTSQTQTDKQQKQKACIAQFGSRLWVLCSVGLAVRQRAMSSALFHNGGLQQRACNRLCSFACCVVCSLRAVVLPPRFLPVCLFPATQSS
jgi:hypothetical protein